MRKEQQNSVFISGANVGSVLDKEILPTLRKEKKTLIDDGKDLSLQDIATKQHEGKSK